MDLGSKIRRLRKRYGLTLEELASRTDLSKGFISQLERNLTSPSIATLTDILECLGTDLRHFFNETEIEKVVFTPKDIFIKEDTELSNTIHWLIPNAQKNALEPILITLEPGGESIIEDPHDGEEFGYVLSGSITLILDGKEHKVKKNDSFYYKTSVTHQMKNSGKVQAKVLWVSTPPSF